MTALSLTPERSALVVVDVQERLFAAMPAEERDRIVRNVAILVDAAHLLDVPILVTEQYPKGLGPTVPPLREKLVAASAEFVEKTEFDLCRSGMCTEALTRSGRRAIVLVGLEAHICVYQSARGLTARGLDVHVPIDATCSRNLDNRRIAEGLIGRVGAIPTCTETVVFDWVGVGTGDHFKSIAKLVK